MPESLRYILGWYDDLAPSTVGPLGRQPLSYREIEAWSRLTCRQVSPFEVRALMALDAALTRALRGGSTAVDIDTDED